MVLLMGDADDQEVVKDAAGAVASLTSYSSKLCNKVYESSQWESSSLNVLCIVYRGVMAVGKIIEEVADQWRHHGSRFGKVNIHLDAITSLKVGKS